MENDNRLLALLIDGDNAQAYLLPEMLAEINKYGTGIIRRVYGDWTEPQMKSWKEVLHTYALQPVQQFRYTTGKNSTDSALIIDAMDIMYTTEVTGFCIASSDSDYTRLATRIREGNLFVMGIGRSNTPMAFVSACNVFVYTENLQSDDNTLRLSDHGSKPTSSVKSKKEDSNSEKQLYKLFNTAYDLAVQEDGWAHLGAIGSFLRQIDPGFDPRTYGYKQLSQLVEAHKSVIAVKTSGPKDKPIYHIRMKSKP